MKTLKLYIAGKVSKNSVFGTHHWRDGFCAELEKVSGRSIKSFDPVKTQLPQDTPDTVFGSDCLMIAMADGIIVYLSDDISVGASQEILIAKYFKKPVIAYAPYGGKFNGATREFHGQTVNDYKDPFVFNSCDLVCGTIEEVGQAVRDFESIQPKSLDIIDKAIEDFKKTHLPKNEYLQKLLQQ